MIKMSTPPPKNLVVMKNPHVLPLILALLLCFGLFGCNNKSDSSEIYLGKAATQYNDTKDLTYCFFYFNYVYSSKEILYKRQLNAKAYDSDHNDIHYTIYIDGQSDSKYQKTLITPNTSISVWIVLFTHGKNMHNAQLFAENQFSSFELSENITIELYKDEKDLLAEKTFSFNYLLLKLEKDDN